MDPKKILKTDYLDIIFNGRNKTYGGYEMRKHYRGRVALAAVLAIGIIGGAFASSLIKFEKTTVAPPPEIHKEIVMAEPPPLKPDAPPPPPPPVAPPPVKPTVAFTPPVIKPNNEVKPEEKPSPPKKDEPAVVGPKNIAGSADPNAVDPGLSPGGTGNGPITTPKTVEPPGPPPGPLRSVQQLAQFPGGMGALKKYLVEHIRYPEAALSANVKGQVVLEFVVGTDGRISEVKVQRDLGYGTAAEASRVVKGMPKWTPAKQNGREVASYYTLPVTFQMK